MSCHACGVWPPTYKVLFESARTAYICPASAISRQQPETIMTNLSGKTALVTGASRGIGRSTALALAKAGAQVVVHYSSGQAEAQAVVADIRAAGGRADAIGADLAAPDGAHKVAKQVRD